MRSFSVTSFLYRNVTSRIVTPKYETRLHLHLIILVYASMLETLHILPINVCVDCSILMAFVKLLVTCYRLKEI